MPLEPSVKRVFAFVDGQNLFRSVKTAFGYPYPNYDVKALAEKVCAQSGWNLARACFYTGVPTVTDDLFWHHFWTAKCAQMGREGVYTYTRDLRYRNQTVQVPGFGTYAFLAGQEKGIDVRIALEITSLAYKRAYDVAVIFSQDQDLSEVAKEVRDIAVSQGRWIKLVCAFPDSPTVINRRGVNGTDWFRFDRAFYDACIDGRDYRPKPVGPPVPPRPVGSSGGSGAAP